MLIPFIFISGSRLKISLFSLSEGICLSIRPQNTQSKKRSKIIIEYILSFIHNQFRVQIVTMRNSNRKYLLWLDNSNTMADDKKPCRQIRTRRAANTAQEKKCLLKGEAV